MARGRKPQPTALKVLRGNPGKRPLPVDEPQPTPGLPEPPEHLNQLAKAEWLRIGAELARMGVMTQADRAVLAGYCTTYARWAMAEQQIRGWTDLLVEGAMGGMVVNPYIRIANQALELMHKYMVELGLTPSSRTRIKGQKPQEIDELEAFLGEKKARKTR